LAQAVPFMSPQARRGYNLAHRGSSGQTWAHQKSAVRATETRFVLRLHVPLIIEPIESQNASVFRGRACVISAIMEGVGQRNWRRQAPKRGGNYGWSN